MLGIVSRPKSEITVEKLIELFPKKKGTITEEVAELINAANNDPAFNGDEFIETMVSYSDIMSSHGYSIKEYVRAIKFCAYLEAENSNYIEAYKRARAEDDFVKARAGAKTGSVGYNELANAASRFRKTELVKKILTAADMPINLMFAGERYKAIRVLANEMESAAYSKDRINAADKLLVHLKPPENIKMELEVGPSKEAVNFSEQLSQQLAHSVAMQKQLLNAGVDIREATKLGIKMNNNEDIEDAEVVDGK